MANIRPRRMVLGVGNPDRGDDAAGCAVVRRLEGLLPAGVDVIERDGEGTALLAEINGAAAVYVTAQRTERRLAA